jgi:1,4-dihydroxy-2-naphthoyl-CoA synthase
MQADPRPPLSSATEGPDQREARKLAQVLAGKSPELMRMGKTAFMAAIDDGYRQGVAGAVQLIGNVLATDACKEGLTAFVEKRKPVWKTP